MTAYSSATSAAFSGYGGTLSGNLTALGEAHTALLTFLAHQ